MFSVRLPLVAALSAVVLVVASGEARAQSTSSSSSSRKQERARAEKMRALDEEIAKRRAAAPIPDEGTVDMNGVDLHKKRQLEIIEARLNGGNTYGAKASKEDNQYDASSNSAFTVRKFKQRKGVREEKRGYSPPAVGIDPEGEPLVKEQRKFFLRQSRR